jgi:hypothetical protein
LFEVYLQWAFDDPTFSEITNNRKTVIARSRSVMYIGNRIIRQNGKEFRGSPEIPTFVWLLSLAGGGVYLPEIDNVRSRSWPFKIL